MNSSFSLDTFLLLWSTNFSQMEYLYTHTASPSRCPGYRFARVNIISRLFSVDGDPQLNKSHYYWLFNLTPQTGYLCACKRTQVNTEDHLVKTTRTRQFDMQEKQHLNQLKVAKEHHELKCWKWRKVKWQLQNDGSENTQKKTTEQSWRVHSGRMASYLLEDRADILVEIKVTPRWRKLVIRQTERDVAVLKSEWFFGWMEAELFFTEVRRPETLLLHHVFILCCLHVNTSSVTGPLLVPDWHVMEVMVTCRDIMAHSVVPSLGTLGKTHVICCSRWFWLHVDSLRLITKSKALTLVSCCWRSDEDKLMVKHSPADLRWMKEMKKDGRL